MSENNRQNGKAALLTFAAGLSWSFTGMFTKLVTWSSFTLVGVRAVIALLVLGLARGSFRVHVNKGMWISAVGVTATSVLLLSSAQLTTSANAVVLQYTASVFIILYMIFVKKQRPLKSEIIAAFFVMLGVCLCFAGSMEGGKLLGNILGLCSGVTFAMLFLANRYSGNDPLDGVYFGMLLSCPFAIFAFFDPGFSLTLPNIGCGIGLGVGLGFGYLFLALGARCGISPVASCVISNVEPVLNPIWVYLAVGENPGFWGILGAAVVLLSVTVQSLYEMCRTARNRREKQ
jgi:drug/metabolite transporter (DMT)-like permease